MWAERRGASISYSLIAEDGSCRDADVSMGSGDGRADLLSPQLGLLRFRLPVRLQVSLPCKFLSDRIDKACISTESGGQVEFVLASMEVALAAVAGIWSTLKRWIIGRHERR